MSLMDDYKASCVKLERKYTADGEGGSFAGWKETAAFQAVITLDRSTESTKAEAQSETSVYTVTLTRSFDLAYHDVFRRLSDGRVFRVISDGTDKKTPKSAGLDMRQVTAEEWSLPI